MSSFFWNVRVFNKPLKHSVMKEWLNNKDMKFGCILETRVKEKKAERILGSVFKDWSSMTNYEHSQGGRIWLLCSVDSSVQDRSADHCLCLFGE